MKCVQHRKTHEVKRVSDEKAIELCGGIFQDKKASWKYISKSEYKRTLNPPTSKSKSQGA